MGIDACGGRELVLVNCSGCHDGTSETTGFLDLRQPDAQIDSLLGKPASGPRCSASGEILVNADGTGLFVEKLRASPPCGDQMPLGTFPLSAEEIECVQQWVTARVAGR